MANATGLITWSMEQADDGHRTYTAVYRVAALTSEGPAAIRNAVGLPMEGTHWLHGLDVDLWAFRMPSMRIEPEITEGPTAYWTVELKYSTRPNKRCSENGDSMTDPCSEAPKVSGGFAKNKLEVTKDRFGQPIKSSSHELFKGPAVTFDDNRPTVRVEINQPLLDLELLSYLIDKVNDAPLWGMEKRCVKLSNATWEKKSYGQCAYYYTVTYEFDLDPNTFDREILDEGTKVLNGDWDTDKDSPTYGTFIVKAIAGQQPNADDPTHFVRYKDRNGENSRVILNGHGLPAESPIAGSGWGTGTGTYTSDPPAYVNVEHYDEANFLLLDIPTEL